MIVQTQKLISMKKNVLMQHHVYLISTYTVNISYTR